MVNEAVACVLRYYIRATIGKRSSTFAGKSAQSAPQIKFWLRNASRRAYMSTWSRRVLNL